MPNQTELPSIYTIRRQRVLFDSDLARLFEVSTKVFNQAIRRNLAKFPSDFIFKTRGRGVREVIPEPHKDKSGRTQGPGFKVTNCDLKEQQAWPA